MNNFLTLLQTIDIQDVLILAGGGLLVYGFHLVWHPLGFITAGVLLLVPGLLSAMRR